MSAPYVKIVEQPAGSSFRFRYESEGRFSGSIQGVKSTHHNPSYPKIEIGNYTGNVIICISCVTQKKPYLQHPHKISSKTVVAEGGVHCVKKAIHQTSVIEFNDIGVISIKKNDIEESLRARQMKRIDPTRGQFDHISRPQHIDLQSVRLCFQVLMLSGENERIRTPLGYAISNPIMDKRSNALPKITEVSSSMSSVMGDERIILLCDKVKREDISIVFYEESGGDIIWREEINYQNQSALRVHHQHAISFLTPKYREIDIRQPRKTFLQLYRPSDKKSSEPIEFEFVPNEQSIQLQRKKHKKVCGTLKEPLKYDSRKPEVKIRKSKHVSNVKGQMNILGESNRNNTVAHLENPEPLINLEENNDENIPIPYIMNYQEPSTYQTATENAVASASTVQQCQYTRNTGQSNDFPAYYYTPCIQQLNANIGQHAPYNSRSLIVPTVYQTQMPEEQQTFVTPVFQNNYADPYPINHPSQPIVNQSLNPYTNTGTSSLQQIDYYNELNTPMNNKPSDYSMDIGRTTNIHNESNGINLSDYIQKDSADLMKIFGSDEYDDICNTFKDSIELSKEN